MAFTWQGSDKTWVIYKDAVSSANGTGATVTSLKNTAQKPLLGVQVVADSTTYLDGWLANIRVSNIKLASGTVSSRRTTLSTGGESDLMAYWPFQALAGGGTTRSKGLLSMMGVGN